MWAYGDKYNLYSEQNGEYEYEVLNELKDLSNRKDSNVLKHTRFLFEFDDRSIEEQASVIQDAMTKINIRRIVFSGNKSLHTIVELAEDLVEKDGDYKIIWEYLHDNYFRGADRATANPARLTRSPNVYRKKYDTVQVLKYEGEVESDIIPELKKYIVRERERLRLLKMFRESQRNYLNYCSYNKFSCEKLDYVREYLETPFLKMSGNGKSDSLLYASIKACQKYKDNETLDRVLNKARSERWSERELNRKLEDR